MPQKDHTVRESDDIGDARLDALTRWLSRRPDVAGLPLNPASGDASFRRYFRLSNGSSTWIAMDAPPPMEDCRPFIEVAGMLAAMSLTVPDIIDADLDQGFVLMTDLGEQQYLHVVGDDPATIEGLYGDAIAALLQMQRAGRSVQHRLPPYDEALLRFEMSLFSDWLVGRHLGDSLTATEQKEWQSICDLLTANALAQEKVFVHRDYHSRNLMRLDENNPGILDFQDAVEGPITYDLASLLKDCYLRLPVAYVERFTGHFCDALDDETNAQVDRAAFWRSFELMGVQRHLKAAGIFARLLHRDGKQGYMPDVPRTLRYIADVAPAYPELEFLAELIAIRCLPKLEATA